MDIIGNGMRGKDGEAGDNMTFVPAKPEKAEDGHYEKKGWLKKEYYPAKSGVPGENALGDGGSGGNGEDGTAGAQLIIECRRIISKTPIQISVRGGDGGDGGDGGIGGNGGEGGDAGKQCEKEVKDYPVMNGGTGGNGGNGGDGGNGGNGGNGGFDPLPM